MKNHVESEELALDVTMRELFREVEARVFEPRSEFVTVYRALRSMSAVAKVESKTRSHNVFKIEEAMLRVSAGLLLPQDAQQESSGRGIANLVGRTRSDQNGQHADWRCFQRRCVVRLADGAGKLGQKVD